MTSADELVLVIEHWKKIARDEELKRATAEGWSERIANDRAELRMRVTELENAYAGAEHRRSQAEELLRGEQRKRQEIGIATERLSETVRILHKKIEAQDLVIKEFQGRAIDEANS